MALVAFVLFAPVPLGREDVAQAATPELTITYAGTTVGLELRATAHLRMTANATGTIRFDLYGPNDDFCATSIFTSTVAVVPGQEAYQSDPFTTSRGGDYRWTATYSGDPNNTAVATPCGGPVRVSREGTSIATDASGEVALGGSISDTAHLTRGFHPTGSITFSLFGPLDVFCEGQPVFQSTVTVDHGAGDYVSGSTEPLLPGTYRWMAAYTGDENNLASGPGSCSDPREDVLVVPLVSTTSSTTTSSSIPGSTTSSTAPTSSTTTSTTPGGSTTTTTTPGGSTTSSTAPTSSTTTSTTPGGSTTTTTTPGGSTSTTSSTAPTSSTTLPGGSTTTTTPGGSTTTTTTPGGSTTTTTPGGSTTTTTTPGGSTT
ncbi:MAG: hypothetical protein QOE93_2286, partial [Actinomycetota bacterium]|nr:hypothetical protein [Actinomycetota bacterium]